MVARTAKLTRFGVSLSADLIASFDRLTRSKGYKTRSEAIGDLMRESLIEDEWQRAEGNLVGTVTIVYNHGKHGLSEELNALQHSHHQAIVCATHVHMDEHNCLEVIVIRGTADVISEISDRLISTKGVKHGKVVCTSAGPTA
jgi:CopG family nickel-responsive transcriptional regulator